MMKDKLCILICSNFYREAQKIIDNEGYENVLIKSFPSECGVYKRNGQNVVDAIVEKNEVDCQRYEIICTNGCFNKEDGVSNRACCNITQSKVCFDLLLNDSLVAYYMKQNYYLVTPGWIENWEHYVIDVWKFDEQTAREYFGEFTRKIMLLNTEVSDKSIEKLSAFSEFVGIEYEVLPVGLDYLNKMIEKIVIKFNSDNANSELSCVLNLKQRELADYAMIFDLMRGITQMADEDKVVENIFEIVRMLFGARKVMYISLTNGAISDLRSFPENIDVGKLVEQQKKGFDGVYKWTESGCGFVVKIKYANDDVGIICIDEIPMKDHLEAHLNTFLNINDVCGLAISNARKFDRINKTQAKLQLQKSYF